MAEFLTYKEMNWHVKFNKNAEEINALSDNKAPAGFGLGTHVTRIYSGSILNTDKAGFYYANTETLDKPTSDNGYFIVMPLESPTYRTIVFFNTTNSGVYRNRMALGVWHGWERFATVDTTQNWIDLVVSNNYTSSLQYSKDSANNVQISGLFSKSTTLVASETIAQLPVGFRPSKFLSIPVCSYLGVTTAFVGILHIATNGVIQWASGINSSNYAGNSIALNAVFKATN